MESYLYRVFDGLINEAKSSLLKDGLLELIITLGL